MNTEGFGPLKGIRIIEMGQLLAGPFVGSRLADFGAEVIKIEYDSSIISFKDLLSVFFSTHDPTTLNRQGNDIGTQYRSSVFTNDDNEVKILKNYIEELDKTFEKKIVTTIEDLSEFYLAENFMLLLLRVFFFFQLQ